MAPHLRIVSLIVSLNTVRPGRPARKQGVRKGTDKRHNQLRGSRTCNHREKHGGGKEWRGGGDREGGGGGGGGGAAGAHRPERDSWNEAEERGADKRAAASTRPPRHCLLASARLGPPSTRLDLPAALLAAGRHCSPRRPKSAWSAMTDPTGRLTVSSAPSAWPPSARPTTSSAHDQLVQHQLGLPSQLRRAPSTYGVLPPM